MPGRHQCIEHTRVVPPAHGGGKAQIGGQRGVRCQLGRVVDAQTAQVTRNRRVDVGQVFQASV